MLNFRLLRPAILVDINRIPDLAYVREDRDVIDEGLGVDPTVRAKIFDPFFTTKPSGTGLGLSICREIADFHRARLTLLPRSILGGTIAEVEFPCMAAEPQQT